MPANPTQPESFGQRCAQRIAEVKRERTIRGEVLTVREVGEIIDAFRTQERIADAIPATTTPVDAIYGAYPRKVAPKKAKKAIVAALASVGHVELLRATQAYAAAVAKWPDKLRFHDGRDTVPHPATWFNRGSYADDPKEWECGGEKAPTKDTTDGYRKF